MKTYEVEEIYRAVVKVKVKANSLEEAKFLIENGEGSELDSIHDMEHNYTHWDTLKEVN